MPPTALVDGASVPVRPQLCQCLARLATHALTPASASFFMSKSAPFMVAKSLHCLLLLAGVLVRWLLFVVSGLRTVVVL